MRCALAVCGAGATTVSHLVPVGFRIKFKVTVLKIALVQCRLWTQPVLCLVVQCWWLHGLVYFSCLFFIGSIQDQDPGLNQESFPQVREEYPPLCVFSHLFTSNGGESLQDLTAVLMLVAMWSLYLTIVVSHKTFSIVMWLIYFFLGSVWKNKHAGTISSAIWKKWTVEWLFECESSLGTWKGGHLGTFCWRYMKTVYCSRIQHGIQEIYLLKVFSFTRTEYITPSQNTHSFLVC